MKEYTHMKILKQIFQKATNKKENNTAKNKAREENPNIFKPSSDNQPPISGKFLKA